MDLTDLIAQLKSPSDAQSSNTGHSQAQPSNYRQPFVSTPIASPPLASPQPQSLNLTAPGVMSPANAPISDRATSDRTTNLLNLLKFNQPASGLGVSSQAAQVGRDKEATRTFSASNIETASTSSPALSTARNVSLGVSSSATRGESPRPSGSATSSDLLLRLLNPSQASARTPSKSAEEHTIPETVQPMEPTSSGSTLESKLANPEALPSLSKGAFTYINPFEQLAASSPRNKPANSAGLSGAGTPDIALKSENVAGASAETVGSPPPPTLSDGRTQIEALLGIGTGKPAETTVAQALGEVGEQVDREAQEALARANAESTAMEEDSGKHSEEISGMDMKELQDAVYEAAAEIQQELKDDDKKAELVAGMPDQMAEAFETTINEIVQENVADSWESADAESAKEEGDTGVRVFNFPMKPFIGIDLVRLPAPREIRQDIVMKIASMKKEFDQIDRTLASATSNFIVYAMAKGGGLRIIRQEDGANKQVFRKTGNDIYNVGISGPSASPLSKSAESVLATGVNGSVFWTSVSVSTSESFEEEDLDKKGFVFPPLSTSDDNTSGGQLKTRAKLSSRHPEFFAVSRGKAIHVIWPSIAASAPYIDSKTRVIDTEKYLSERCLKIATGKSGKDFAFSEDDTIIVSLDKAGRLKFWDIREHIDPSTGTSPSAYRHVETKTPLMMLATTSGVEKSWATSVLFVDKERPMVKGVALRYLLVGSKQNHTLQLWDLGLGKPVQEINFPHESETDAICSVSYHSKSGIIAVGHPTRNSVFFIYLSSPRYNLGTLNQAEFVQRLASGDTTLPKPESTAIMTGIRELSLAPLGHLRSLEICEPAAAATKSVEGGETLFELYVSHSRGIACLDVKRQDLGWDKDGKVLKPVNAAAEEMIQVKELRMPQATNDTAEPIDNHASFPAPEVVRREESKDTAKVARTPGTTSKPSAAPQASSTKGGVSKSTKSEPPMPASSEVQVPETSSHDAEPVSVTPAENLAEKLAESYADVAQRSTNGSAPAEPTPMEEVLGSSMNIDAAQLGETISRALGNTLSAIFGSVLGEQLETLYKKIDDDKRVQEAAGAAKQDAVLRLVSSTLTENVEKSLTRIVTSNIQQSLLPAINGVTSQAIKEQLSATVPRDIKNSLQGPISKAMQEPEILKSISDHVSAKVTSHVESVFANTLSQKVAPAFQKLAVDTARKASSEVEARVVEQIQKVNVQWTSDNAKMERLTKQHDSDSAKIDQLTTLTMEVLGSVRGMSKALADAQAEIINLKLLLAERETSRESVSLPPTAAPRDEELEQLISTMASGRLVEGTIKWLQSARRVDLFDQFFAGYDPNYLKGVDQLIILSVCAAVTDAFEKNVPARLNWLEVALNSIDSEDPVVAEHASKVMDVLVQRLSDVYMAIAEMEPSDPMLIKIHALVRLAKVMKKAARRG